MVSEAKSPRLLLILDVQLLRMLLGMSRLLLDPTESSLEAKTTFLEVLLKEGKCKYLSDGFTKTIVSEAKSPRLLVILDVQLLRMHLGMSRLLLDPTESSLEAKTTFLEVLFRRVKTIHACFGYWDEKRFFIEISKK